MDDKDIDETLALATDAELAEWWCFLNAETLMCNHRSTIAVMNKIASLIGMKECLRYWNKDRMNDDEYNEWWSNRRYL